MTGILRSLIWKEWHELKWKAAALVAVAVATLVALQAPILSGLVAWSLWRFGRVPATSSSVRSSPSADRGEGGRLLVSKKDTPLRALVWLQWRQLRPLCLLAVLSIPAWAVLMMYGEYSPGSLDELLRPHIVGYALHSLGEATLYFGVFVAVLAAIGAFSSELEPRLAAFWRSRPVGYVRWFWVKYFCGVATLVVVLSLPTIVGSPFLVYAPRYFRDGFGVSLLLSLPLHILVFTVTVCLLCLTRLSIQSGILGSAIGLSLIFVPEHYESLRWMRPDIPAIGLTASSTHVRVPFRMTISDLNLSGYLSYLGTLLGLTIPVLLNAWFVVKRRLR